MDITPQALVFTLAAIGISETVYLVRKRKIAERPICPIGGDCGIVLTSKYNKTLGIPNDLLGLFFYSSVSFMTALMVVGNGPFEFLNLLVMAAVASGSLMSLYFTYLQWRVIKAWCFWCLMSATTIWLMATIILISLVI
jgi:uncharacterized membrane protein